MTSPPKTIQIFLPAGDPRGIRVAEITTRIVQVIEVPRSLLPEFLKMPESGSVALYFLIGETEDREPQVYIGQTGDLSARLVKHHKEKDFWQRALVLISRTQSITGTHALFLEWHSIQMAKSAGRYRNENGNGGSKPHTPAPLQADCLEIFETGRALMATLGHPIFEPVAKVSASAKADAARATQLDDEEVFYCRASGTNGRGLYTQEGFVVLKGSTGRKENVPSFVGTSWHRMRLQLLESGVMREQGDSVVFEKDHLFNSPSMAAVALMGRNANGWHDWKNKAGKTLDVVKRQAPPP